MTIRPENPSQLQEERNKLFADFYANITPERMPVSMSIPNHLIAQYGNIDPFEFQYDFAKLKDTAFELCGIVYSDSCPIMPAGLTTRIPSYYGTLGSNTFIMGNDGYMQHPESASMLDTEYDDLINDPMNFIASVIIQRQYSSLNPKLSFKMLKAYDTAKMAFADAVAASASYCKEIKDVFGYYKGAPMGSGAFTAAPFDYLSDQLRGFSGISVDIRRHKDKIKRACEILLPFMFLLGMPSNPHNEGAVGMPLHMPPFMSNKDFEELWFPEFKKLLEQFAARGARASAFCEGDWTRYLDCLKDLPSGTKLKFEYGDARQIKDTLGDKMILSGLYPLSKLKTASKEECIDAAKELLDIMMPGCGYVFDFDKVPLMLSDVNLESYAALSVYIRDYAVYPAKGAAFGKAVNSENYSIDKSIEKLPHSELDFDADLYGSKNTGTPEFALDKLASYDKNFYKYCLNLLL